MRRRKDAVFFARYGYDVSAFDVTDASIGKTRRLAEQAGVRVNVFKADMLDYRLGEHYDILFSSGVLHYMKPEFLLRTDSEFAAIVRA